jgi:hypothetical protein
MDIWIVDPSLYKIEKYFLYELEHRAIYGVKSDSKWIEMDDTICRVWIKNELEHLI